MNKEKWRALAFVFVLTLPVMSAAQDEHPFPTTCEGAIEDVFSNLGQDSIHTLRETMESELSRYHFSWGKAIRNGLGLWEDGSPIVASCAMSVDRKTMHPDDVSMLIIKGVWQRANADEPSQ